MSRAPDVVRQLTDPVQCVPLIAGVFFVAVYAMCMTGLFSTNAELVSVGLLLALSAMASIYMVPRSIAAGGEPIYFLPAVVCASLARLAAPVVAVGSIGTALPASVLAAASGLSLFALAALLAAFLRARDNAMAEGSSAKIEFGNQRAGVNALKVALAVNVGIMWTLYCASANRAGILAFMRDYLSPRFGAGARGLAAGARAREGDAAKLGALLSASGAAALALSVYCAVAALAVARAMGAIPRI